MLIPCDLALKQCLPCNDDPVRNITAEAPDVDVFIGFRDFKWNPFLGDTYFQLACKEFCFSEVSQEDADLCALRAAEECVWGGGEPPGPPVPPGPNSPGGKGGGPNLPPQNPRNPIRRFRNTVQSCDALCPDGSPFTETVPAGTVVELSQALANAKAHSLACNRAHHNLFCLSSTPPPSACVGDDYFFLITTNIAEDLVWSFDGNLPPGLDFNFDGTITGTPLVGGSYTFVVEVSDSLGRFQSQILTICIMEIVTESALPVGSVGVDYAVPLIQQAATVSSEVWTLVSGSLPPGILLAANGALTGSPTENGVSDFTLMVEATCNGSTVTCQKAFTLTVGGCNCGSGDGTCGIDFSPFAWNGFLPFAANGLSTASGSAVGNTLTCDLVATSDPFTGTAEIQVADFPNFPFVIADTANCSFKLKIDVASYFAVGFSSAGIGLQIFQDGLLVFQIRNSIGAAAAFPNVGPAFDIGCNEYDIPLVAAINSVITIGGDASETPTKYAHCESTGAPGTGSAGLSMTMKLCNT